MPTKLFGPVSSTPPSPRPYSSSNIFSIKQLLFSLMYAQMCTPRYPFFLVVPLLIRLRASLTINYIIFFGVYWTAAGTPSSLLDFVTKTRLWLSCEHHRSTFTGSSAPSPPENHLFRPMAGAIDWSLVRALQHGISLLELEINCSHYLVDVQRPSPTLCPTGRNSWGCSPVSHVYFLHSVCQNRCDARCLIFTFVGGQRRLSILQK